MSGLFPFYIYDSFNLLYQESTSILLADIGAQRHASVQMIWFPLTIEQSRSIHFVPIIKYLIGLIL